ncbi:MAG TPA: GNAT family N-acetyltransferase [Candidatus Competibacter sp.]|nr:GNAT family N-acetyltransferase [Candidatus Competibacter sp.]
MANADGESVYRLWQEALGPRWPLSPERLATSLGLAEPESEFVGLGAFLDYRPIGAIAAEIIGEDQAALILIAVVPDHQRRGVGTGLLDRLKRTLGAKGIRTLTFGAGASQPLWHGVPISLPSALAFFERHGGILDETSYDLVGTITDFRAPESLMERAHQYGITFETLRPEFAPALLAFEREHFPFWQPFFVEAIANGALRDVLIARRQAEIAGGLLLSEAPYCPGAQWAQRLGPRLGAFGILGVAPAHRERGVGLALAAYATEHRQRRGVQTCFLHWTDLRDWYSRLGFRVWEEYRLGQLPVVN